jgi:hypothetical protein
MNLAELYEAFRADGESGETARALLKQTHWFAVNVEFDPKTGEALPQALSAFLAKVARPAPDGATRRDRLWRIAEHSRSSVERLFRALNESPRREQALLPVRAVRELDANSFIKLSNRPGRNIREKLAGKPYLQAVRRFQSVDLPENRLLKAFVRRLAELLELRRNCLGQEDELLPKIQSWLRSDEAQDIGHWDNPPPNNTLLSHRDYRRVWDAWRWLQTLDDDITRDLSRLDAREKTVHIWERGAQIWADGKHLFAEFPLLFDYEKFNILPWSSKPHLCHLCKASEQHKLRRFQKWEISESEPVCVDLTVLHPRYAAAPTAPSSLPAAFLWQQWRDKDKSVDIELFDSDALWLHPQATTVSASDLFFSKDNSSDIFDRAARSFASKLRDVFRSDTFIWLVSDFLNDFELEVVRRNLNARFPAAEPLPRSVAAVFERTDLKIREGLAVVVVDSVGGKTCVTKLLARSDPELEKRLPKTKGFYWERCPSVIIANAGQEQQGGNNYDITTVDAHEEWHDAVQPVKTPFIESSTLGDDSRIGQFDFVIKLTESPVAGGIRLHALQRRAGDIPLWRDRIPELSIKVMKHGIRHRFDLVSRGTTVKPIRGKAISIPVEEDFTLPAGSKFYRFPLFLGEQTDDLGFEARLNSLAFPLKKDTVCKLDLTFEYGADDPYKLVFTPQDGSFPPVRATWRRTEETVITDAPAPEYPTPKTWEDLQNYPKPNSDETHDLLKWVLDAIEKLDILLRPRTIGKIVHEWRTDRNDLHYTRVTCDTIENVFIHEKKFVYGCNYADFNKGDSVSFRLQKDVKGYYGLEIAKPEYEENFSYSISKSLYFPFIQIWSDGRSICDRECPKDFVDAMTIKVEYITNLLKKSNISEPVKDKIRFLLSCMHKDTTDECIQWITKQVKTEHIQNARAVGFALGDVSEQWQKDVLSKLAACRTNDVLRVFAYAIWREMHFVEKFSFTELQNILQRLKTMLEQTTSAQGRATAEPLELLLGLLRTRASTDPEIRMLLQPGQKITKELVKQVERVTEIIAQSKGPLYSRVQINLQKPEGNRTPDLLYALNLYLTGDDGANAIHVARISDSDND